MAEVNFTLFVPSFSYGVADENHDIITKAAAEEFVRLVKEKGEVNLNGRTYIISDIKLIPFNDTQGEVKMVLIK